MNNLPRISIVIPTRDRTRDLSDLLSTILNQSYLPFEVIIVDDSLTYSAKQVANSYDLEFESIGCRLKYVKGSGEGLTDARNLGTMNSKGDVVLFLDDDTLLDQNANKALAAFFRENPGALGVQPRIISLSTMNTRREGSPTGLENAIYKALMLTYEDRDIYKVRRSGYSVRPNYLTKVISAQRLSGCCCYRREVFDKQEFDTNLKRWSYMEDLDFSYRLYKKKPNSLFVIPNARIIHKKSNASRQPTRARVHMMTIYWFYVFLKDIFEGSVLNLIALLWASVGNLVANVGVAIKRKMRREWWALIYLLESYATAFRNLKNIFMLRIDFFNEKLN